MVERSEPIIRSGFARVVCGLSPLRRGIISSPPLPAREADSPAGRARGMGGRGGVSQRMRCAAVAGWLCKASRGPRSGWGAGLEFAFRVFHPLRVELAVMSVRWLN
jgi:hypothetical protein